MAYLPFRQKDLDRLQNSKTTVRRAVRELPLATSGSVVQKEPYLVYARCMEVDCTR